MLNLSPLDKPTPLLLKILAVITALYALLPSLGVAPVATEGFEAAVTHLINQIHFAPSAVPVFEYLYSTRPGEFLLYKFSAALIPADALAIGQVWSLVGNLAALIGVIVIARRALLARPFVAAIAYFSMFDLASSMAQVSASNLATAALFTLGGVAGAVSAAIVLTLAVFFRLDVLILIPFAPPSWRARSAPSSCDRWSLALRSVSSFLSATLSRACQFSIPCMKTRAWHWAAASWGSGWLPPSSCLGL